MNGMTDQEVANAVAEKVLGSYDALPQNGKPIKSQFTCLSGMVARVSSGITSTSDSSGGCSNGSNVDVDSGDSDNNLLCVCLATGTKCLGSNAPLAFPGCTLADSHAEVLCRRAFNRYLLQSIRHLLTDSTYQLHPLCPVERVERHGETEKEGSFRVKRNWEFWMYISDSPCGDASIYERIETGASYTGQKTFQVSEMTTHAGTSGVEAFSSSLISSSMHVGTPAAITQSSEALGPESHQVPLMNTKSDSSPADTGLCRHRQPQSPLAQMASLLRTKPGRKDIHTHLRSSSMSCSDKLARWMCLGTQGALLAHLLESPVNLSGLVVSTDTGACEHAQLMALQRALSHRVTIAFPQDNVSTNLSCCVRPVLPCIAVTPRVFRQGKTYSENSQPRNPPAIATATATTTTGNKLNTTEQSNTSITTSTSTSTSSTAGMSKRQQKKAAAAASSSTPKIKPAGNNLNWILDVPALLPVSSSSGGNSSNSGSGSGSGSKSSSGSSCDGSCNVTPGGVRTHSDVNKANFGSGSVEVTLSSTGILQGCTATSVVAAKDEEYRHSSTTARRKGSDTNNNKKRTTSAACELKRDEGGGDGGGKDHDGTIAKRRKGKDTNDTARLHVGGKQEGGAEDVTAGSRDLLPEKKEHTITATATATATAATTNTTTGTTATSSVPGRLSFQSRLCRRELGHLFYEITSKLDNKENNKSVIVGTTITSKSNENNNCKVTHESGSNSSEEEGDNVSVSVNAGSADEPPQYDHSNYHIYKKYSSKYALKRDVFLQNLAFRDWLTDNNI